MYQYGFNESHSYDYQLELNQPRIETMKTEYKKAMSEHTESRTMI